MPPGGYAWWYVDGTSDDGQHAITIIAFIGSVFSPYYAVSRRKSPVEHVAMNAAVYSVRGNRWAMTERRADALEQTTAALRIGPSWMSWDGSALTIWLDEIGCPFPRRIRGRIKLRADGLNTQCLSMDRAQRHRWQPIATTARIEVELDRPRLSWSGTGYFDTNDGDEPLQAGFRRWDWCRASVAGGTVVQYDVSTRSGEDGALTAHIDRHGQLTPVEVPAATCLPRTPIWRIERNARTDPGGAVSVVRTLEDTPFYARSLLSCDVLGVRAHAVHESLDLDRFNNPVVLAMLPFRMPRRTF